MIIIILIIIFLIIVYLMKGASSDYEKEIIDFDEENMNNINLQK
jgi:hypothetical protein